MTLADFGWAIVRIAIMLGFLLSVQTLCEATGAPAEAVEAALRALQAELAARGAIQLVALAGGYQLATKPEYAFYIARLLNPPQKRLSRGAGEGERAAGCTAVRPYTPLPLCSKG